MIFEIIGLFIIGFFIYQVDKEIRKEDLLVKKMKDWTLNDIMLTLMGIAFVVAFLRILLSLF
jgi:hypothetical protein